MAPVECGLCGAKVIEAFTATGSAILLDLAPSEAGSVAARIDPHASVWKARYLDRTDPTPDPFSEVRFRQHTVTCPGPPGDPSCP